ncbi:MAG: NADH-quinone oxidoreductase subunit [Actinomycetota bacterium]|nr:NADH-quinone oxidoreductase subunit [Actinomycetota bacterium]
MENFPWLTTLALVPLVGAIVIALMPERSELTARKIGVIFSVVPVFLVVAMGLLFDANSAEPFQFTEEVPWIPSLGVSYSLGVDGIALVLLAMTVVLVPIVLIGGWHEGEDSPTGASAKGYVALVLALETCIILVFAATDVFLFYVFFEVMLIPMFYLIGRYGGPQRQYAAMKFLIYSLLGGLFMLASLIGLYVTAARETGDPSFSVLALADLNMDPATQKMLFLGFFFAFAVKAPMVPFHTWLPDAAAEAKPGTSVLMVGLMDKVGTFGMIRLCLPIFPDASAFYAPVIMVVAVIGIIYGALLAIGQTDMLRLVAYTSISHFGFIVLGIFVFTTQSMSGATLYMVTHGLTTAGLLMLVGYLITRRGSKYISDYGGVSKVAPVLAGLFLISGLASVSLPGLGSFVSEFLVLLGTFTRYPWLAVVSTFGVVLAAIYILWWYQRAMTGPVKPGCEGMTDLRGRETVAVAPAVALLIAIGFFPQMMLNDINPAVDRTMVAISQTDPAPTVDAATVGEAR